MNNTVLTLSDHQQHPWIDGELYNVAGNFYKCSTNEFGHCYVAWKKEDLTKKKIKVENVETFDGWANQPDFLNYCHFVKCGDSYLLNASTPLMCSGVEGLFNEPKTTLKMLGHVFGEHMELMLDWIYLLLSKPQQPLFMPLLYSPEQKTGKSTVMDWLCALLDTNACSISVRELLSEFNGQYASKVLAVVDESVIRKEMLDNLLKKLSTARSINVRRMYSDASPIKSTIHFMFATNDEDSYISPEDTRFFVHRVPPLRDEDEDPMIYDKVKTEMPDFIKWLRNRGLKVCPEKKSRLWFSPDMYMTDEKKKLQVMDDDIDDAVISVLNDVMGEDSSVNFTITQLTERLQKINCRITTKELKSHLTAMENVEYIGNTRCRDMYGNVNKGRYYRYSTDEVESPSTIIEDLPF